MEVTDEGGASTALEILDTEAKRPGGTELELEAAQAPILKLQPPLPRQQHLSKLPPPQHTHTPVFLSPRWN